MTATRPAWTAAQVADALGIAAPGERAYSGVSTDTRSLRPGDLFVALVGDRFDGHRFLAEAQAKGAAGAVVRLGTPPPAGLPAFAVEDTLEALGALARARRRRLPAGSPVVAITGSSGKTSVKEMTRAVLATAHRVHATHGNLNNLVGVPLTMLAAAPDADALVVEAGASIPGEIARLRRIIEPTIGVVTNVGHAHVEGFGSLAGVLAEKISLLDGVPIAVVGTRPPELGVAARGREASGAAPRTIVAGLADPADVRPEAWVLDDEGRGCLTWRGVSTTLPVAGAHQVENAMLALAVAEVLGIDAGPAVAALGDIALPPGRATIHSLGGFTVIDDTYNANPDSLRQALALADWLARKRSRPLAVVVGSMLELGEESDRLHATLAAEIAARSPVLVGAVGAFVGAFTAHRAALGTRLITADDAETLGPALRSALRGNEIVLLKASRGVALERVLQHLR